jgi:hypothetical protein
MPADNNNTIIAAVPPPEVGRADRTAHRTDMVRKALDFPLKLVNLACALRLAYKHVVDHGLRPFKVVIVGDGTKIMLRTYMRTPSGTDRRPTYDVDNGPTAPRS